MSTPLRDLPDGTRFMLCRTRQMFRLVRRVEVKGRLRLVVRADGRTQEGTLHHSCYVKPAIRILPTPALSDCIGQIKQKGISCVDTRQTCNP